nr:unnamed protein product [Spirometra erinaceieuropaei]
MPPDENVAGRRRSRRKAEDSVSRDETMFRAGPQEEVAVIVATAESMRGQHSLPGSVACPNACTEVIEDYRPVQIRHSRQDSMYFLSEFILCLIGASHWALLSC